MQSVCESLGYGCSDYVAAMGRLQNNALSIQSMTGITGREELSLHSPTVAMHMEQTYVTRGPD